LLCYYRFVHFFAECGNILQLASSAMSPTLSLTSLLLANQDLLFQAQLTPHPSLALANQNLLFFACAAPPFNQH
jgi:hypothetical protein